MTFRRRNKWWLMLFTLSPLLAGGSYIGYLHGSGNFHSVVPHEAYRSGQLDAGELAYYLTAYNIKSILNLRGTNLGSAWYAEERRVAQELHVKEFDYGISANHDVLDSDIDTIMEIISRAPKPILIHCRSGADRTGLVSALYLYRWGNRTAEEASRQLSIFYGHLPLVWSTTFSMDRTFWRYVHAHGKTRT